MTQNAISAYARTAQTGHSNRELEAMLLLKSATRMKTIQDQWDRDHSDLDGALLYNRKLWTILSVAATDDDNELPNEIKKNIALIAIFIFNRSVDLMIEPHRDGLNSLIEINQNIALGLMSRPQPNDEHTLTAAE